MMPRIFLLFLVILLIPATAYALPNPAAVYCRELGYGHVIERTENGERGLCLLPSGECEEWKFLRGECGREYSYCSRNGYGTRSGDNEAFCLLPVSSLKGQAEEVPVSRLVNLEGECDSKTRQGAPGGPGERPPLGLGEHNASDFDCWDWRDPPNSTVYGSGNYTYFDWTHGWATPVRNQVSCGSCWAFSSVGAVEARYELNENESRLNPDLSEEYLVSDCHPIDPYWGQYQDCCGGYMEVALNFTKYEGISDEGCFPYVDSGCSCSSGHSCSASCTYRNSTVCSDATCSDRCSDYSNRLWTLGGADYSVWWENFTSDELKQWLLDRGPLSVGLYMVNNPDGQGFINCGAGGSMNHGVVLVGYNDTGNDTTSYWILKNSWGSSWAQNGYFKVRFDDNCHVGDEVHYINETHPPEYKPFVQVNSPGDGNTTDSFKTQFNFTVHSRNSSTATCDLVIEGNRTNTTSVSNGTPSVMSYALDEGSYSWEIMCWESGIGITNTSGSRTLSVSLPPSVNVASPSVANYTGFPIDLNVTTDQEAGWCGWNLNGTGSNTTMTNSSLTEWHGSITNATKGVNQLYVYCNDTNGSTGSNSSIWFVYDTPPSVSGMSLVPTKAMNNSNVTVTGIITDENHVDYALLTGYNSTWGQAYGPANMTRSGDIWSLTFNSSNKTAGLYYFNITAFDDNGNNVTEWAANLTINSTGSNQTYSNTSVSTLSNQTFLNTTLNTTLQIKTLEEITNATLGMALYSQNPAGESNLAALGRYLEIASAGITGMDWAVIRIYYAENEVNQSGANESSLRLYYYNESSGNWTRKEGGANGSENYVWGNTSHFSIYGVFESTSSTTTTTTTTSGGGSGGTPPTTTVSTTTTSSTTTTKREAPVTGAVIENTTTTTALYEQTEESSDSTILILVPILAALIGGSFIFLKKTKKKIPVPPKPTLTIKKVLSGAGKYEGKKVLVEANVFYVRKMKDSFLYSLKDKTGEIHGISDQPGYEGRGLVEGIVVKHGKRTYIVF